jgi:hypothetical protein
LVRSVNARLAEDHRRYPVNPLEIERVLVASPLRAPVRGENSSGRASPIPSG